MMIVGVGRFGGKEHNDGSELGEFTVVWSKNRLKVAMAYGGS